MTANKACLTRLQKEYKALLKDPVPHITAHPSNNLLEWHYVLEGASGTDYAGGVYHGKLTFPPQYPFKPPSISLFTPNGRFAINTKLCLSMTDYHPESWNPMWSVGTILTGLLSFMVDPQPTTGSITSTSAEKRQLAAGSLQFNMRSPTFRKLFPEWVEVHEAAVAAAAATTQEADPAQGGGTPGNGQAGGPGTGATASSREATAGGARGKHGQGAGSQGGSSSVITLAVVIIILAIAVAPLLSGKMGLIGTGRS